MLRFIGYCAVIAALLAFVTDHPLGLKTASFFGVLLGFPASVILDVGFRKRPSVLPTFAAWTLRAASLAAFVFMLFLVAALASFVDTPVQIAEQGPDTPSARECLTLFLGPGHERAFRNVYFFRDPDFHGKSALYLRFDYEDERELAKAIPPESQLTRSESADCDAPDAARPSWYMPAGTQVGPTYMWRTDPRFRICFESFGTASTCGSPLAESTGERPSSRIAVN